MKELIIVKIGGNIIDSEAELKKFLSGYSKIKSPKILVHGGGKLATQLSQKLGIETKMVEGRRITDAETLKITTMVYAGWINKSITAQLNAKKNKAIGLCGADVSVIKSTKRKKGKIDYGFVGDVLSKNINSSFLMDLLKQGITPIISPITADAKGQLLNTNADTIASCLAVALNKKFKVKLIYCFEKEGVLNGDEVISTINSNDYQLLKKEKIITDGMIPKLDNAFDSLKSGVKQVIIGNASKLSQLLNSKNGTRISI